MSLDKGLVRRETAEVSKLTRTEETFCYDCHWFTSGVRAVAPSRPRTRPTSQETNQSL